MRLFAKRKRTPDENPKSRSEVFQSDKLVVEILKKDPASWNSKERRMVKRYRLRNPEESSSKVVEESLSNGEVENSIPDNTIESLEPVPVGKEVASSDESSNSGDSSEGKDEDDDASSIQSEREEKDAGDNAKSANAKTTLKADNPELRELLEKINSKQRRKFTRMMDRGEMSPEEVKKQALELLGESASPQVEEEELPKSKRRRRKAVDWSTLPPEERLRREEQRRKQKEATERREKNHSSSHRHPLNSERRRANRRKPKFAKKEVYYSGVATGNDHNLSGFHMRKLKRADELS